jgi:predicted TIM-barrel fold metal-dependent hydrolase
MVPPIDNSGHGSARMLQVDSHIHVFTKDLSLAAERRHTPDRDALLDDYLRMSAAVGITHAVIVAPSFLGTDNGYLIGALRQAPERLRGTVIVDPGIAPAALREMDETGVVGIRLNLYLKKTVPDLASPAYRRLFNALGELGWHVEIYAEGDKLNLLLPILLDTGLDIVVDHFGSPAAQLGIADPGFQKVLKALEGGRTWAKLSGPYRQGGADTRTYADALLQAGGPERLLWGSDWPWVAHDTGLTYRQTYAWLSDWIPDAAKRAAILGETPGKLFRFA